MDVVEEEEATGAEGKLPSPIMSARTRLNHVPRPSFTVYEAWWQNAHVEMVQKGMEFGGQKNAWQDVEVDQSVFDKKLIPLEETESPSKTMMPTKPRSPGPGPIKKCDWKPIADKRLKDKQVLLHTDSARAYNSKTRGVLHASVVHKKRQVSVGGRWVWQQPTYVKLRKVLLPINKRLTVKIRTQIVDLA
ncbi:unnamed protein product [Symbiodinium sp. CCMP2592]|nr:unnamed protein product [Symbiodinium sp. CCMP2592]